MKNRVLKFVGVTLLALTLLTGTAFAIGGVGTNAAGDPPDSGSIETVQTLA